MEQVQGDRCASGTGRPDKRVIDVEVTNRVTFAHYGEHAFRYITFLCMEVRYDGWPVGAAHREELRTAFP